MTRIPSSAPATTLGSGYAQEPIDVAGHQNRLVDARRHVRVEAARLGMCCNGLFVKSAVATGVDETRKQFRIVPVTTGFAKEADERSLRLTDVRLEIRVELVRDREVRIDRQRVAECVFRSSLAVCFDLDVLADHAVAAPELGPSRSEARIQFQTALVQLTRPREAVVCPCELVGPEVELVGLSVVWRVPRGRRRSSCERKGQRVHHAFGNFVLQLEQIAQRQFNRVRCEQRSAWRLDELDGGP